jgi:hypothetical protein
LWLPCCFKEGGEPICFDFVGLFRVLSPKGLSLCCSPGLERHITCLFFLSFRGQKVRLTTLGRGALGGSLKIYATGSCIFQVNLRALYHIAFFHRWKEWKDLYEIIQSYNFQKLQVLELSYCVTANPQSRVIFYTALKFSSERTLL